MAVAVQCGCEVKLCRSFILGLIKIRLFGIPQLLAEQVCSASNCGIPNWVVVEEEMDYICRL